MADALALFDARRSKWANPDGTLTREAQIFLRDLWVRVGGAHGSSNNDLSASQFEDAGIEEQKAMLFTLASAVGQTPPAAPPHVFSLETESPSVVLNERVAHLETVASEIGAMLAETRKELQGIQQGLSA